MRQLLHKRRSPACETRLRLLAGELQTMSATTARLIAAELVAELQQSMQGTPELWASSLDITAHVQRHGQTLCFLAENYRHAKRLLPWNELGESRGRSIADLLDGLAERCDAGLDQIKATLRQDDMDVTATPKFYYSELRLRRKCILPSQDQSFPQRRIFSFLAAEAISSLRIQERFELISSILRRPGDEARHWDAMATMAEASVLDIVSAMVGNFGEKESLTELQACLQDEQHVSAELLDGSTGRVRFDSSQEVFNDDDDDDFCLPSSAKPVFVVSDCTGESAERTLRCALGQFGHCFERHCPANITTFRFATAGVMEDIAKKAQSQSAFIVFTLVDPVANARLKSCCEKHGVTCHDLWSPLLEKLEGYFDTSMLGVPGNKQYADGAYMELIDCIEYTRTLDDGVQPKKWAEADLMIVGPSRSGKTPLAFFLAQRGYKVANYPLVPDEAIPKELYEFPQERVFALTIDSRKLADIRTTRMKNLKMGSASTYAQMSRIKEELAWCTKLYKEHPHWSILDTTDAGIEENTAMILKKLDELGVTARGSIKVDNPSAI